MYHSWRRKREGEILTLDDKPKKVKYTKLDISVSDADLKNVSLPHDDPLVIAPIVDNFKVQRVLVDTGALVDILYWNAFKNMGLEEEKLEPSYSLIKLKTLPK